MSFFNSEQSFEDIFYSYLNNVSVKGELFSYDDEFLEDDDYYTLFKKIVSETQRFGKYSELRGCHNSPTFLKSFHRCFGIYLREATLRYATSFSEEGLWRPLNEGIEKDFSRIGLNPNFWGKGSRNPRTVLTGGVDYANGHSLFYAIFNSFRSEHIRYRKKEENEYTKHLLKLAVLPHKYNPVVNYFDDVLLAYRSNAIDRFLEDQNRQGLNIHPKTRERLAAKIRNFFIFVDDAKQDGIELSDIQNSIYANFGGWLQKAYQNQQQVSKSLAAENSEYVRESSQVKYRLILGTQNIFQYHIPKILSLKSLFPDIQNLRNTSRIEISDDEDYLFTIDNNYVDIDEDISNKNRIINRLIGKSSITVEYKDTKFNVPNPWYMGNRWHILNEEGEKTDVWNCEKNIYLVIPSSDSISTCEMKSDNNTLSTNYSLDAMTSEKSGMNVYKIEKNNNAVNFDKLCITTQNGLRIIIEIENPSYVHLCHKFDGHPQFIAQKNKHKIAIGRIEFSHLDELDTNPMEDEYKKDYCVEVKKEYGRLIITNKSTSVIELPEKNFGRTIIPAVTLLPEGTDVWIAHAEDQNSFRGYLQGTIDNLSHDWNDSNIGLLKQSLAVNIEQGHDSICSIRFAENGESFNLISPYLKANLNMPLGKTLYSRDIARNNNPFDGFIPNEASYYFKWTECERVLEATIPLYYKISVYHCYEKLGINGAECTFGWAYEGTRFCYSFKQNPDYTGCVSRPENFYDYSKEELKAYFGKLLGIVKEITDTYYIPRPEKKTNRNPLEIVEVEPTKLGDCVYYLYKAWEGFYKERLPQDAFVELEEYVKEVARVFLNVDVEHVAPMEIELTEHIRDTIAKLPDPDYFKECEREKRKEYLQMYNYTHNPRFQRALKLKPTKFKEIIWLLNKDDLKKAISNLYDVEIRK